LLPRRRSTKKEGEQLKGETLGCVFMQEGKGKERNGPSILLGGKKEKKGQMKRGRRTFYRGKKKKGKGATLVNTQGEKGGRNEREGSPNILPVGGEKVLLFNQKEREGLLEEGNADQNTLGRRILKGKRERLQSPGEKRENSPRGERGVNFLPTGEE